MDQYAGALLYLSQIILFAFAACLHGITGMAFPMIGTIALALIYPLPKAIIILAIPSLLTNVLVLRSNKKQGVLHDIIFYTKKYKILILSSIVGSVFGVLLLVKLPVGIMYLLMGIVTLYYVVTEYLSQKGVIRKIKIPIHSKSTVIFGVLSGVVGGATNAMSPILMMYLFSATEDKDEIVKSSNICYFFGKIVQLILLTHHLSAFNQHDINLTILITIFSVLFLFIGMHIRQYVNDKIFKNLIYLILLGFSIKVLMIGIHYFMP